MTDDSITTPASCKRRPTVTVLGAGIAGLTAAQELAERGFVVTVYEAARDERNGLGSKSTGTYPPVKLGGLAASQYSTVGTHDGSLAELRPFPSRRGHPIAPGRAVAGEHGFRFFPAYYLHIWDMFQRIPVYQLTHRSDGTDQWTPTPRTVYDNVRRVVTQGVTADGEPSLVFPRERPRSVAESLGVLSQLTTMGFTPGELATYQSRLVRYLVTSPLRRATELQNISAYDFLVGYDSRTGTNSYSYTPRCDQLLQHMPRVLVALDSRWGDARTNLSTNLQLYLSMDRRDNKADGVLNGPTTESWFDHWYHHLRVLGVRFVHGAAVRLDPPAPDPTQPPHLRPRAQVTFADGSRVTADYTVVAVDAPAAENLATALREGGTGGTAANLNGFTTTAPPPDGPLQPDATRPRQQRNPYVMDELGRVPWDRFQTLCGIQYYFDTEFQLVRGHMLYTGTEWALSSVNQTGLWEKRPILDRDGHVSVLSVDIGDFNTPSSHLVDEFGQGKTARDCTPDEIASEVWRQLTSALTTKNGSAAAGVLPWPLWYALDRGLIMETGSGQSQGQGRVRYNRTPYLVPIVGDWGNRPSTEPWNPHGTSWTSAPSEDVWLDDLEHANVWQARHGGYQVHNNSVVFAGTWNKTFTRLTSMEAACESGRHAVNAILDHYIWVDSGGADRREKSPPLEWEFPYGFLDQSLSSPIRMPTPAGDYCYVFDIENREPADTRALRNLDSDFCERSLPHPLDTPAAFPFILPALAGGQQMFTPSPDYMQQLFAYLQAGQQLLAQWTAPAGAPPPPTSPPIPPSATSGGQFMPPMPLMAATPFATQPAPPVPADYAQQLFGYLQAWRQYLEQTAGAAPEPPPSPAASALGAIFGDQQHEPRPHQSGTGGSDVPIKPGNPGGSKGTQQSDSGNASFKSPPPFVPPSNKVGTQLPDGKQPILIPPSKPGGNQIDFPLQQFRLEDMAAPVQATAAPTAGTAFQSALSRVDTQASPQVRAKSLFGRADIADPAANLRDLGENPTR